jgi:hypothetical protein
MSSINTSQRLSSGSTAVQSKLNLPPANNGTKAELRPRVHGPLAFSSWSLSISPSDLNRNPFDTESFPPYQDMLVSSCPTNTSSELTPSVRVPRPGHRHTSSRSSFDENRLSSETPTPPISNETSPSGSADQAQRVTPSPSCPIPSRRPFAPSVRPASSNISCPWNFDNFSPPSRSSRESFSGDTLVDQYVPPSGLDSVFLLEGSMRLTQRFYEANRYELLHRFLLVLRVLSQSLPINGYLFINSQKSLREFLFMNFMDVKVMNALSYFSSSVSTLTPGLTTNSPIGDDRSAPLRRRIVPGQQDCPTDSQRAADGVVEARPNPNDPWGEVMGSQRQRQAMKRSSEVYARMVEYGHTSQFSPESSMGIGSGTKRLPARRLLSSESGVSRIVPQELFVRQSQITALVGRENSKQQDRPAALAGVVQRPLDKPPTLPTNRISRFQYPSDSGRWHGSPPTEFAYPPRPTYVPTMARPIMGGPANFARLPGTVLTSVHVAPIARIDFGHGPDFTTPRPVSGQAGRAMQRMARWRSHRGRGIDRGRDTMYGRYH